MEIIRLDKVDSTHRYLKDYIKEQGYKNPVCVVTAYQTNGIGSRGNTWLGVEGNLFFSFVLKKQDLAQDLPLHSASIYFSFILKDILKNLGSKLWLKWPNDFYMRDKKIGGTITTVTKDLVFCGIGLNLVKVDEKFSSLDIKIKFNNLLSDYFKNIEKKISWKQIFSEYKIEYSLSRNYYASIDNKKVSLKNAVLNNDGSIQVNNKKVFSLR